MVFCEPEQKASLIEVTMCSFYSDISEGVIKDSLGHCQLSYQGLLLELLNIKFTMDLLLCVLRVKHARNLARNKFREAKIMKTIFIENEFTHS